jgi:hypothetical protein
MWGERGPAGLARSSCNPCGNFSIWEVGGDAAMGATVSVLPGALFAGLDRSTSRSLSLSRLNPGRLCTVQLRLRRDPDIPSSFPLLHRLLPLLSATASTTAVLASSRLHRHPNPNPGLEPLDSVLISQTVQASICVHFLLSYLICPKSCCTKLL